MADETTNTVCDEYDVQDALDTSDDEDAEDVESPWHQDVAALKKVLEDHKNRENTKLKKSLTEAYMGLDLGLKEFEQWKNTIIKGLGVPAEFLSGPHYPAGLNQNGDIFPVKGASSVTGRFSSHENHPVNTLIQAASSDIAQASKRRALKNALHGSLYGAGPFQVTGAGFSPEDIGKIKTQVGSWGKDEFMLGTPVKPLKGTFGSKVRNTKKRRNRKKKRQPGGSSVPVRGGISMHVHDAASAQNLGQWNITGVDGVLDKQWSFISMVEHGDRNLHRGIMCQPVLLTEVFGLAGYSPACGRCPYGLHCLRQKLPNVCAHCRATVPQHFLDHGSVDRRIEKEYVRLQRAEERVSTACPLFEHSLTVCELCVERIEGRHPQVTRLRIPDKQNLTTARYKNIRLRYAVSDSETFAQHVAKKQSKKGGKKGDLHERQRTRYQKLRKKPKHGHHQHDMAKVSTTPKKVAQQKSRGPR